MGAERIAWRIEASVTYMTENQQKIAGPTRPPAAIRRSRTLHLPAVLDNVVATTLADTLNACHGEDVVIDASYVQQTSATCAQVLKTALEVWRADHRLMTLVNEPSALTELLLAS
jgi:anti-anti-sigma regulatory factor